MEVALLLFVNIYILEEKKMSEKQRIINKMNNDKSIISINVKSNLFSYFFFTT